MNEKSLLSQQRIRELDPPLTTSIKNLTAYDIDRRTIRVQTAQNTECGIPFTGQRQHSLSTSGVSHTLQTQEVKS